MPVSSTAALPERPRVRQIVLWAVFTALLVVGLVLYFRYGSRIAPLIDAAGDR